MSPTKTWKQSPTTELIAYTSNNIYIHTHTCIHSKVQPIFFLSFKQFCYNSNFLLFWFFSWLGDKTLQNFNLKLLSMALHFIA